MKPRDLATYAFLTVVWGLSFVVALHATLAFGWIGAVTFRVLIASAALYAGAWMIGRRLDFSVGWRHFVAVGATTVAGQLVGISFAIPLVGTAMTAILAATIPLFSMLIGQIWGLERMTPQAVLGLLMGIVGIALLVGAPAVPVTPSFLVGAMAALLGAFASALGSNYASRYLRSPVATYKAGHECQSSPGTHEYMIRTG